MVTTLATSGDELRLAELLAALSLGVDLGFDQPMEHVLRQTVIAMRLADRLGTDLERPELYYASLLVNVACHADAHEQAKWFGDDMALKASKYRYDQRSVRGFVTGLLLVGSGHPPIHRARVALAFVAGGHREVDAMIERHAAAAAGLASRLRLDPENQSAVGASYERWDGHGWPGLLRGNQIPIAARLTQFAEYMEVAHRLGGVAAARHLARDRAGSQFDPQLVAVLNQHADSVLAGLDSLQTWQSVIDAEPELRRRLVGSQVDEALGVVADFVDLKSPYTLGHSRAVAELASGAGRAVGLTDAAIRTLRRAGLVHGLGRLGVSNAIWDKPGPLGVGEWERFGCIPTSPNAF